MSLHLSLNSLNCVGLVGVDCTLLSIEYLFNSLSLSMSDENKSNIEMLRKGIKVLSNLMPQSLQNRRSSGPSSIPMKLPKMLHYPISVDLSVLINGSFVTGVFLDELKIAKVIPILKSWLTAKNAIIDQFHFFHFLWRIWKKYAGAPSKVCLIIWGLILYSVWVLLRAFHIQRTNQVLQFTELNQHFTTTTFFWNLHRSPKGLWYS